MLSGGLEVRQIRRLLNNGRQVPLITTDMLTPMDMIAGAVFSRWSQENYFKYMREEFNLDALAVHGLEQLDSDAVVVNPARRKIENKMKGLRNRLGTLRNKLADNSGRGKKKGSGKKKNIAGIKEKIDELEKEIETRKAQVAPMPGHLSVGELSEEEKLESLPQKERLFLDIIRMAAYRAETRMMPAVMQCQGKKPNARKVLQALFTSDADILPDQNNKILRVRFLGLGSDSYEAVLGNLIDELNATNTIFPGTDLRMVYELPQKSPEQLEHGSI